jgi:hypothetical protein
MHLMFNLSEPEKKWPVQKRYGTRTKEPTNISQFKLFILKAQFCLLIDGFQGALQPYYNPFN